MPRRQKLWVDARSGSGRRIRKQVWANTAWTGTPTNDVAFVYDGWNLVAVLNATNHAELQAFLWGLDLSGTSQGAGGVSGLIAVDDLSGGSGFHFAAFDGNGNVSALVKASDGTASAAYEYGPFGEVIRATGPLANENPFRFETYIIDLETGRQFTRRRFYYPRLGRFLSRDPIEESGGDNFYAFVQNSPPNCIDPLGLATLRFEVVRGLWVKYPNGAGTWGQPFWSADGDFSIDGTTATSWVALDNEFSWWDPFYDGWYCNTVTRSGRWSEPLAGDAGSIEVYVSDCAGGTFTVTGSYNATLAGTGPATVYSTAYLYGSTGRQLSVQDATHSVPIAYAISAFSETVTLNPGQEKLVLRYDPVLRFNNSSYTGGQASYGFAGGTISVSGVNKAQ